MKNNFLNWFSKHDDSIFCIVIASVATAVEHYIVGKHPDYMLFFSILAIGFMLVKVVRILFWKNHKRLFLTFLCATINIVIINHFYSYQQFLATFPFLATYDPWILLLGVSGSILAVLLVVRLSISTLPKLFSGSADGEKMSFYFLKKRCSSTNKTKEGACKPAPDKSETIIIEPHGRKLISAGDKGGKDFPPRRKVNVGAILAIVACIIALGVLGLGSYNLIQVIMHEIRQNSEMNYENITSRIFPYILCWGIVSILLLLLVACFLIIISELIKSGYHFIKSIVDSNGSSEPHLSESSINVLSYAVGLIIFCISSLSDNHKMSDLFNFASGDYLAYPLILLLQLTVCLIIARFASVIISFSITGKANDDKDDIVLNEIENIAKRTFGICTNIFNVVLDAIEDAVLFIKFIPDFFSTLYCFVMSDEEDKPSKASDGDSLGNGDDTKN